MRVLGIETSCDETSAAVVEDGRRILSNVVVSQEELHREFGGIFPEVASRQQVMAILPVVERSLERAGVNWSGLDGLAVTYGPGLAGSLLVGVNAAKGMALASGLPLLGVNHLEGHLYANWLTGQGDPALPAVGLIVSGGHTQLLLMEGHGRYRLLGQTLDDAAGEAFDKVARLLGLGFPGGPAIERAAGRGDPQAAPMPRAWLEGSYDFSFSGLKTAVLREVEERFGPDQPPHGDGISDVAAGFQASVVDVLVEKTVQAALEFEVSEVLLTGGVAANRPLRAALAERLAKEDLRLRTPPLGLCTDNAAMIAAAGYFRLAAGERSGLDLDVVPDLGLF